MGGMAAEIRPRHPERLSPCARSAAANDARRHDLRRGRDGGLRIELARPGASRREVSGFPPSPLGEGLGMRAYESGNLFSYLCGVGEKWHSKTKYQLGSARR